ncbi:MAG: NAD(P)-binding protein, partial [Pseudomonadota bacterium]
NKPLCVYMGLAGQHAFNSDRHHFFMLQGARAAARELSERGIALNVYLPDDPTHRVLPNLVRQAACSVFEIMPVKPFNRWQPQLAGTAQGPVLAVDARCIVPMTLSRKAPTRAFAFRDKFADEYSRRIATGEFQESPLTSGNYPPVSFEPLALAELDDAALLDRIATLAIDHSIGPVADTPGGSIAGYRRWQTFLERGLKSYHRRRNNANERWPLGVSRMSAYLHHGHVSPWRIARSAADTSGGGSEKFLDELTVWRELAHHWCWHTEDPDSLAALPEWARETLKAHALDPRPARYSLRTLQHGRTNEPLWNLAQRSLLIHGELHNNLRMTWAKAIPGWCADPEQALATLLDLNHRYALDGNDPASYGGLLWALGLFDRPFNPPQPVLGAVRGRSLQGHAARLDVAAYADHVGRTQGQRLRVAVVGAGVAGMAAAGILARANHDVSVFEKSRGPGGRVATRRRETLRFDHGAQYLTAKDPRLARHLDSWLADGQIESWPQRVVRGRPGLWRSEEPYARWRGAPGMNAVARAQAEDLPVTTETRVTALMQGQSGWIVCTDDQAGPSEQTFDAILLAIPAPQAAALLEPVH